MQLQPSSRTGRAAAAVVAIVAIALGLLTTGAAPAAAEVVPICFPVIDQPANYYGTFGDSRGGGTRAHEGEDIMGRQMHRIVAPVDGVILNGTDGLRWRGTGHSDHSIRMRGDDGVFYAFLHMNNDTPGTDDGQGSYGHAFGPGIAPGVRVRRGQLLGYMGDSGNAEGAGHHLHFEMRRGSSIWASVAFDPYDSLQAAARCGMASPVHSPTRPFTVLGGATPSDPDTASSAPGVLDYLVRGSDNGLWHRAWVGGFTQWVPVGGYLRSAPAAASPHPGRLDVFVRGGDDQLWQRTRVDGAWGSWQPLGGLLSADPDATSSGNGDLTVAVRGQDGAVWIRTFDGASWGAWLNLGGQPTGGPGLASTGPGLLSVYVNGPGSSLWSGDLGPAGWSGWGDRGGLLTSDPDAAAEAGHRHVVVRGSDRRLWHLDQDGTGGWALVTTSTTGGGAALTSRGAGQLDVTVAGLDRAAYQGWWADGSW